MNYSLLRKELREYYANEADFKSARFYEKCMPILDSSYKEGMSLYEMKRLQYSVISDNIDPIVFNDSLFYYETGVLASICDGAREFRGHKSPAGWTYWKNYHFFKEYDRDLYELVKAQKAEKLYLVCGPYNDLAQHFYINCVPVFKIGLKGIHERINQKLVDLPEGEEKEYLSLMIFAIEQLKKISEKFSDKARELSKNATANKKEHFMRIWESAARCPWNAPQSFYEALNTLAFMRKVVGSLEGVGFSSFGRIDLDLEPFYRRDIENGVLSKEEAYELISAFLITWDSHYDQDMPFEGYSDHELENSLVLGGCDENGNSFKSDLTLMFLKAAREHKTIYPKIMLRYSSDTPREIMDEAAKLLLMGRSVILYQNDESTINALIKMGRSEKEARDYIVSGCWDLNCRGVEKRDAGAYVNLIKVMELCVWKDEETMARVGMDFAPLDSAKSFDELYRIFLGNLKVFFKKRAELIAKGADIWSKVDVLPLFSMGIDDCIEKARDFTDGGAKYRDDSYLLFSFANVVDSLLAIKEICFEEKLCSLESYLDAVRNDWADKEDLRIRALKCSGWGDGKEKSNTLARRLFEDMRDILSSLKGCYGGKIGMGFLGYTEIRWWGEVTRATPDGRKSGEGISQGLSPSKHKKIPFITDPINALASLKGEDMGGNSVVNLILPSKSMNSDILYAFLMSASKTAAQSLQLNCTCLEDLLDAQKNPEKHNDLVVRVAGFSAKFTSLSPQWQDEFITRNFYS